jgi:hypothetical protein
VDAYGRWSATLTIHPRLAFMAYKAALEIEEEACAVYGIMTELAWHARKALVLATASMPSPDA